MSALLDRPRARQTTALGPGLPQVNLLPPEVRAARALRHTKQWLLVVLLLVLASLVVAYALAVMSAATASAELIDAQADSTALKAEQGKYAEVQPVISAITRTEDARTTVMAPEVQWKAYLDAISAVLPGNVSIEAFSVTQASAIAPAPTPPDALTEQGIATVLFTAYAPTLPDSAAWTDALNSIPGFYGATTSSDTRGANQDDVPRYDVTSMVQVDVSALLGRFPAASAAGAADDAAATDAATDQTKSS